MGCTSALVGVERGKDGRWLLWKHRDSGHPDNYVRAFPRVESREATDSTEAVEGRLAYVALFNSEDMEGREAWIGFNEAGFAVMNTATYNIPAPRKGWEDREGLVMTEALGRCRSLNDFYRLLLEMPRPRGVQANFGAFDAEGNGAYFETDDNGCVVFPLEDGLLTRTNFSISGGQQNRLGHSRYLAENHLLDSLIQAPRPWAPEGKIAPEDLIETLSRSLWLPTDADGERGIDLLEGNWEVAPDNGDVISRRSSCASVAIQGPLPGEDPAKTMVMWSAIGFPTLAIVEAVTLDSVPDALHGATVVINGKLQCRSAECDSVNILRERAFIPAAKVGKASRVPAVKPTPKTKYYFNLPYLREQIPLRRAESLRRYRRR